MTGAAPVQIVPLQGEAPDQDTTAALAEALGSYLRVPVVVAKPIQLPEKVWVGSRLSSNVIVDAMIEQFDAGVDSWTLAVTAVDLVAPGHDFVFGEAALGGKWAVVSAARLSDAHDSRKTVQRLFKESLHELGHLAGLGHCATVDCIMCRSSTVAAVDLKNDFCQKCVSGFFQSYRS